MGWIGQHAYFYKNGKVDRKAECDYYFERGEEVYKVLKSAMVGSTYYAAVKPLKKYVNELGGKFEDIPEKDQKVFAAVFLTSTNMKDYFNFSYKDMSEDMGPNESKCPKGILDLLSETDNEYALAWRKRCRENLKKKKSPSALGNLPLGSVIRFKVGDRERCYMKCPPSHQFKTPFWYCHESGFYIPKKYIPDDYKVIRYGY